MTYPDSPLSLMEAIDIARAAGLTTEILAGFTSHTHGMLVSVATTDPDPTVSLRTDSSRRDELLSERSQSGPEAWDYPTRIEEFHDRIFLRISSRAASIDVALLPAVLGVVERHGFVEDAALSAPARVGRTQFEQAIGALTQTRSPSR